MAMTGYLAPVNDMRFALYHLAGMDQIAMLTGSSDMGPDVVDAVLEQAAKFAESILAPLNAPGDRIGSRLEKGRVLTPPGFAEAWRQFVEAGWNGLAFDPAYGGQGLPWLLGSAVQEIWHAANMAFALNPMLTQGAVELLSAHGSDAQKAFYLPKLIEGVWTGTMNLTEPQAGSDLSAIRCRAVPDGGSWRLHGQKIFITYGDHDMADNIVHFVLARLPDAPEGVKGISLFLAPKFLPAPDGGLGPANDLRAVSLERKLGIHASPTCVMSFGDKEGARAWLVGEANRGLEYMFTMMNNARLSVGLEGVAIAERAYQQARAYARERKQGRPPLHPDGAIVHHPDVRRMLMLMKARTEAARALAYSAAAAIDLAKLEPDPVLRAKAQARADLLIPMVKSWCTETGISVADLGVQVHGGMGYIEETGATQHLRDSRIAAIYEGTNGIQANDLVFRKIIRDKGAAAAAFLSELQSLEEKLAAETSDALRLLRAHLSEARQALEAAIRWMLNNADRPADAAAGATPFLRLFAITAAGGLMAKAALIAAQERTPNSFCESKIVTARIFAEQILVEAPGLLRQATVGAQTILALAEEQL